MNGNITNQSRQLAFQPPPLARNRHIQTLLSLLGSSRVDNVPSNSHHIAVDEADAVGCEESCHPAWQPHHPTVVLIHGMGGTHLSSYIVRMTSKLICQPYRVIRMNLRGCGTGIKLCRRPYHGGLSEDIWHVLRHFHKLAPQSPTVAVAYSMGANMLLKLAGERGAALNAYARAIIAVCPPFSLQRSLDKMRRLPFSMYERYLVSQVRRQYEEWTTHHPHLKHPKLPAKMTITDFDNIHTIPCWGFRDTYDYYRSSSCGAFISTIDIPCTIVCAADDPIVDTETVHMLQLPSCVRVWQSDYGGHMGFVGLPWETSGRHWLDQVVLRLIDEGAYNTFTS